MVADDDSEPKTYTRPVFGDVFDWLDSVRLRPGMFVRNGSLTELEMLLFGYGVALDIHGLDEGVPRMGHFGDWLSHQTGWSPSLGWATAIEQNPVAGESALDTFFRLADEYRRLRPVVLCSAALGPHHGATGRHIVIGMGSRQPTPLAIEVIQYQPEPLHFLRFHYPDSPENRHILTDRTGSHTTTAEFARRWAEEEFQIRPEEWAPGSDALPT